MDVMVSSYLKRISDACDQFDVENVYPIFFQRMSFYLCELVRRLSKSPDDINDEGVMHALLETHTIIVIDEDMDGLGMERMIDIWEDALSIEYGIDYTFE